MPPLVAPAGGGAVASINFSSGSSRLGSGDEATLRRVAEMYRRSGGRVSVVGHASASAAERADVRRQIANFSMSMDRANAVAQALQRYGVPSAAIEISAQVADAARADVFFLR
jgi:outer membrane protein OmpA-like peptidoglycan-associated protein